MMDNVRIDIATQNDATNPWVYFRIMKMKSEDESSL